MGSPGPAWDAAWEEWRTHNSCLLLKKKNQKTSFSCWYCCPCPAQAPVPGDCSRMPSPPPELSPNIWPSLVQGCEEEHQLLRASSAHSWGRRAGWRGAPNAHHLRGEHSPLRAVGKEHPCELELSSPASLLPRPAGLGSRCAGSDEVMVLNIAISSQPFSPATPPGSRRPPAGSARDAGGCGASPGLCGAARAWCHSAALWAPRPQDGDAPFTPHPQKNPHLSGALHPSRTPRPAPCAILSQPWI